MQSLALLLLAQLAAFAGALPPSSAATQYASPAPSQTPTPSINLGPSSKASATVGGPIASKPVVALFSPSCDSQTNGRPNPTTGAGGNPSVHPSVISGPVSQGPTFGQSAQPKASSPLPAGASIVTSVIGGRTCQETFIPTTYSQFRGVSTPITWATSRTDDTSQTLTIASGGVGWMVPSSIPDCGAWLQAPSVLPFGLPGSVSQHSAGQITQSVPFPNYSLTTGKPGISQVSTTPVASQQTSQPTLKSLSPSVSGQASQSGASQPLSGGPSRQSISTNPVRSGSPVGTSLSPSVIVSGASSPLGSFSPSQISVGSSGIQIQSGSGSPSLTPSDPVSGTPISLSLSQNSLGTASALVSAPAVTSNSGSPAIPLTVQRTIVTFVYNSRTYSESFTPSTYAQASGATAFTSFTTNVQGTPFVVTVGSSGVGWNLPTPIPGVPFNSISEPSVLPTPTGPDTRALSFSLATNSLVSNTPISQTALRSGSSNSVISGSTASGSGSPSLTKGASTIGSGTKFASSPILATISNSASPGPSVSSGASVTPVGSPTSGAAVFAPTYPPAPISTQSFSTIIGVTSNTEIVTTGSDGKSSTVPVLWHCWFCGGGGLILWGIGPGPGIYPPPITPPVLSIPGAHWPTIAIGPDKIPTPGPSPGPDPSKPTPDPSQSPSKSDGPSTASPSGSSTASSSGTSSTGCVTTGIPQCTQSVKVVTSVSGTITSVQSVTTSVCNTISACSGAGTTATSGSGTAATYASGLCGWGNGACATCAPTASKLKLRALQGNESSVAIQKRTLRDPSTYASQTDFLLDQMSTADWVPPRGGAVAGSGQGLPSDVVGTFGTQAGNWAVDDLRGCTSAIIISRGGVWLSHLWEIPYFAPALGQTQTPDFYQGILQPIMAGQGPDGQGVPMAGFGGARGNILATANSPTIIIVTVAGPGGEPLYDGHINELTNYLQTSFGGAGVITRTYVRDVAGALSHNSPAGKVLVRYDPAERWTGCTQMARAQVWLEAQTAPLFDNSWPALPNQQVPRPVGQRKRQACSASPSNGATTAPSSGSPSASAASSGKPAVSGSITAGGSSPSLTPSDKTTLSNSVVPSNSIVSATSSPSSQSPSPSTSPSPSSSSTQPAAPYATGKCRVNVNQALGIDYTFKAVYLSTRIYDANDVLIGVSSVGQDWGKPFDIPSKLPFVMINTPKISGSSTRRHVRDLAIDGAQLSSSLDKRTDLSLDKRVGAPPPATRPQFEKGPVLFDYAAQHWTSASKQCVTSDWDNGNFADQLTQLFPGITDFLGFKVFLANREMNCEFDC